MIKNIKESGMFFGLLFSLLLFSSFFSSFAVVSAVETDVQDKTIQVLNSVIGINTTEFINDLNSKSTEQYQGLEKTTVDMSVISTDGQLRISSSFVENVLHQIYICNYEGTLAVEKASSNTVEMARTLLGNYENYVGDSFYGQLKSMLADVDGSKNVTNFRGNIKLDVKSSETINTYLWTYVDENGIIAKAKKVLLSYENGQLKVFRNDWPLYTIVSNPTISGKEATEIALEASKTFSYEVCTENGTLTISEFEISQESLGEEVLCYLNHPNQTFARGGDPFTLYPSWYVPLGFTKAYAGDVTGVIVRVWADTEEVSIINPVVLNIAYSPSIDEPTIQNKLQNSTQLPILIIFVTILSVFGISIFRPKIASTFMNKKKLFSKISGTIFCGMILMSTMLITAPTVSAEPDPNSVSRVYAALDGWWNQSDWTKSPAQLPGEKTAAYAMATYIEDAFDDEGYAAYDMAGDDTTKENILDNAEDDEDNYDHIALFHFGHRCGENNGYVDNDGYDIWSSEIDSAVDTHKYELVFIFACAQAQSTTPTGTAAAWTNRTNVFDQLSSDGYEYPDAEGQCYISFNYYSPMIGLSNGTFYEEITGPFKNWVEYFYEYALDDCYSVNDALDNACLDFFGEDFDSCILNTGYNAWWPGGARYANVETDGEKTLDQVGWYPRDYYLSKPDNKMRVFGDGNVGISQPWLTVSAGTGGWVSPSGSERYTYGYQAMASANAYTNYDFSHWNLDGQYYSSNQVVTVNMYDDHSLQAIFTYDPPTMYTLSISSSGSGYTSPSGSPQYQSGTYATVYANPSQGWTFDHWVLDSQNAGSSSPINVYMNTNRNLQAVFVEDQPPPTHYVTVEVWGYYPPWTLMYQEGQYLQEGPQQFSAPSAYGGLPFYAWYHNGNYYYTQSIWISIYSDTSLAALYSY